MENGVKNVIYLGYIYNTNIWKHIAKSVSNIIVVCRSKNM